MTRAVLAAWFSVCVCIASAADPQTRSAAVGELVVLDAIVTDGQSLTWHAFNPPSPKAFVICDGGKKLVFSSPRPGTFTFLEVSGKADGAGGVSILISEHRVTIAGVNPPVAPPSDPKPPADPPPPTSKYQLETVSRDALGMVPEERRVDAAGLRLAYLTTVSRIDSGELKTPGEAMDHQRDASREFLGENLAAWSQWGAKISAALEQLARAGTMKSLADHRQALFEIATGLTPQ